MSFTRHKSAYNVTKERKDCLSKKYVLKLVDRGIYDYMHHNVYKGAPKSNKGLLRSYVTNRDLSLTDKLTNLTMVSGLRQKSYLNVTKVFTKFIYILKFEQDSNKLNYMSSRYLDFILVKNIKLRSSATANDFLKELATDLSPVFTLKTQKAKIKKRSKKRQKYKIRIAYVKPRTRNLVALK